MKVNDLTVTQLYIAGSIITNLLDKLKEEQENQDSQKAMEYMAKQFERINTEIASEMILRLRNRFEKIREDMQDEQ